MSRWQIRCMVFYSHHGQRVVVPFELSSVNIIVGESFSGKSALIDSLDYCMGAGECHIPGLVGEKCSWVGVVWVREKTEIVICRALPVPPRKSNEDTYYAIGAPVAIPASAADLHKVANTAGALWRFEQLLQMGEVVGETFNERDGNRISFRNAVPYLLVSDDVIIDKITLLRGMNDERKQSIIDSIPYFLGAVDETTAASEIRLKKLRSQRAKEDRRQEAAKGEADQALERGAGLLQEAVSLGMVAAGAGAATSVELAALETAAAWVPGREVDVVGTDRLPALYSQERSIINGIGRLRSQLNAARDALSSAAAFTQTVERQRGKLDIMSVFRTGSERESCPVCDSAITDRSPSMDAISEALRRLDTDLREVEQDRPQIDAYVTRLEGDIEASTATLTSIREQIAAVIRESDTSSARLDLDQRRMRVAGRVSYFLESLAASQSPSPISTRSSLDDEIRDLESLVNPEAKAERLNALQLQVSGFATDVLKKLPFDETYRDVHVMFDARKVRVQFVRGSRVYDLRDLGGDESYLSGRISALFGLHRVFAEGNRPVPGVIVFDQISRPFYSPESNPGEVRIDASDRTDLKRYFDALFEEVSEQKSLQIIVLEHAYFPDDERYVAAVKLRWGSAEKLIPFDWPLRSSSAGTP